VYIYVRAASLTNVAKYPSNQYSLSVSINTEYPCVSVVVVREYLNGLFMNIDTDCP